MDPILPIALHDHQPAVVRPNLRNSFWQKSANLGQKVLREIAEVFARISAYCREAFDVGEDRVRIRYGVLHFRGVNRDRFRRQRYARLQIHNF